MNIESRAIQLRPVDGDDTDTGLVCTLNVLLDDEGNVVAADAGMIRLNGRPLESSAQYLANIRRQQNCAMPRATTFRSTSDLDLERWNDDAGIPYDEWIEIDGQQHHLVGML